MMTLKRFRVTNFRSIMDSGWIDCDDVTSLVGINEAGKSNVILALWKLRPVRDGEIALPCMICRQKSILHGVLYRKKQFSCQQILNWIAH